MEDDARDVLHAVDVDLDGDLSGFEVETLGDQIRDPGPYDIEYHDGILIRLAPLCPLVDRDAIRTKRGSVVDRCDCGATLLLQPVGDDGDGFVGDHCDEVVLEIYTFYP